MEELIIEGLNKTFSIAENATPVTKYVTKSLSITDVKPIELAAFMTVNNVPNNAYFNGKDNGYDAFDDILISWEIKVPTTPDDQKNFLKDYFRRNAHIHVINLLKDNGYLAQFKCSRKPEKPIYDMYVIMDITKIVQYYNERYDIKLV